MAGLRSQAMTQTVGSACHASCANLSACTASTQSILQSLDVRISSVPAHAGTEHYSGSSKATPVHHLGGPRAGHTGLCSQGAVLLARLMSA